MAGAPLELAVHVSRERCRAGDEQAHAGDLLAPERWSLDELPKGPHTLRLPMPLNATTEAVRVRAVGAGISCVSSVRPH